MTAIIRLRKATDRKFFSIRADQIKAIEDTTGTLTEGGEQQDMVILITEIGNVPVEESSNKVLALLESVGAAVAK